MHFIVLVKQVPDISNIPDNAWDKEKGTLKRGVLDSVLNPLDLHALTLAYRIEEKFPGQVDQNSKIVCLTMGPPQAEEVLIDCLSRGADDAVLLTDRAFSGADTVATAYSLAQAIRKIESDLFGGNKDYMIVSGMQSVDGDTAQVPAQIAEELGIEHIAYASAFSFDNDFAVKRIGPLGMETVTPTHYPVLITSTSCTEPLYRTFRHSRQAKQKQRHVWTAETVGAEKKRVGIAGSRTQVYRIFSPSEDRDHECVMIDNAQKLAEAMKEAYEKGPAATAQGAEESYDLAGRKPTYQGEVWVYIEQEHGVIKPVALELLGKASELAKCLGEKVGAVLPGHQVEGLCDTLFAAGADKVYLLEHPLLKNFLPIPYKKVVAEAVKEHKPQIMLFGATPLGRELAPRVTYATDSGLTADCTKMEIGDFKRGKMEWVAILKQTRPALGGNIMATIMTKDSITQMATVRPGVLKALVPDPSRKGEVVKFSRDISEEELKTKILSIEEVPARTNLTEAKMIVSGGRGLGSKANYDKLIRPLADAVSEFLGNEAEVGASRSAVEEGFIGHDHQVGQTGQTVQPKLYIAVAISGAVQHVSGMQNSEQIVAINKDPHARLFNYAHFGLVGDAEVVVPQLIEAIKKEAATG